MHVITRVTRRFLTFLIALVLAAGYPLAAMADSQDPTTPSTDTSQQAPADTTPTQTAPPTTPPADPTPTTSDPAPSTDTPPKLNYTYNPATGHWDSEKWVYNPATGTYEAPPQPVVISPTDTTSGSDTKSVDTSVTANNNLSSNAASGDSTVNGNTTGGSATTGDAATMANLLNVVNSNVSTGNNQKVATFTQNVMGDVKGDIILYPMLLKAMLESQAGAPNSSIDVKNNYQLNNNVDLASKSGNASVTNNTSAGDATSGSATAVANVVNILNSMIATQQSFIGTINIYGNLDGDILIAPDFIPQMIANNKEAADTSNTQLSNTDTTNIVNNISAVAKSGAASVFGNTTAGDATTGNADTGVVIFNITGHQIVAKNSLLVFVNVLGKWVGVIVDAPAGATSALIGNGVTENTQYTPDLKVNSESNNGITNTISVDAQSGDAVVSGNTMAGGAKTGQAVAMANIANLSNSQFSVADWFGVLFINVFQDWYGSFGVNTPYGNEPVTTETPSGPIQFVPSASNVKPASHLSNTFVYHAPEAAPEPTATLASAKLPSNLGVLGKSTHNDQVVTPGFDFRLLIVAGSVLIIGVSALGIKRLLG